MALAVVFLAMIAAVPTAMKGAAAKRQGANDEANWLARHDADSYITVGSSGRATRMTEKSDYQFAQGQGTYGISIRFELLI